MGPRGILGAAFALGGAAMSAALLFQFADISRIALLGVETEGTVVSQALRNSATTHTSNAPIVSFTDQEGREHTIEGRMGVGRRLSSARTTHATGRSVTVSYLPDQPQSAVIRGFRQHWIFLIWALVTASFVPVGLWFVTRERREMRESGW